MIKPLPVSPELALDDGVHGRQETTPFSPGAGVPSGFELSSLTDGQRTILAEMDTGGPESGPEELRGEELSMIAGVMVGLKPVALIGGNMKGAGPEELRALGLHLRRQDDGTSRDRATYVVSKSAELADLARAFLVGVERRQQSGDWLNDEDQHQIGRLLGYPETATDYFIHRLRVQDSTGRWLPAGKDAIDPALARFAGLVLSPGETGLAEVQSYVVPLAEATRLCFPDTYQKMIGLTEGHSSGEVSGSRRSDVRLLTLLGEMFMKIIK